MNYCGGDCASWQAGVASVRYAPPRPLTPEDKAAREEWRRQYIEDAGRHPYRFFLRFFSAAGFLAFSIWLVYWQLDKGGFFIP